MKRSKWRSLKRVPNTSSAKKKAMILKKMPDKEIDLSDIPEANTEWFKRAKLRKPKKRT